MSYINYKKAINLAKKCNDYYAGKGKPDKVIAEAEKLLNIKFSKQLINYLSSFGFLEFYGHEFYGIIKDDFSGLPEGNIVECTLYDREFSMLPEKWLPIFNFNDGYMGYLDYENLSSEGEPRVIMAIFNGKRYAAIDMIAEDFGDFLLQKVENQLNQQI